MLTNKLLEYVRFLSKNDIKTLSQKVTKTAAELGELSEAVLPFDNAYSCRYKFVEKKHILDESVDVILCALSIAYDLGYNDEEIEEMMWKKSKKWHGRQNDEKKVDFNIPYEIHITVAPTSDKEEFKLACEKLNVKATILDLQDQDNKTIMQDIMTSSIYIGDNKGVLAEIERIKNGLTDFTIVRSKIETVPFHPSAPQNVKENKPEEETYYFEAHLNVLLPHDIDKILYAKFLKLTDSYSIHFSQNLKKVYNDGTRVISLTYRETGTDRADFDFCLGEFKKGLSGLDIKIEDEIVEFAIYDDCVLHDEQWVKCNR